MGIVWDIVKEIPLSGVLKEKILTLDVKIAELETENSILKSDLRKVNAQIEQLTDENKKLRDSNAITENAETPLHESAVKILRVFANHSEELPETYIQQLAQLPPTEFSYYFQDLRDQAYLEILYAERGGDSYYGLKQKGRKYLLDHPT